MKHTNRLRKSAVIGGVTILALMVGGAASAASGVATPGNQGARSGPGGVTPGPASSDVMAQKLQELYASLPAPGSKASNTPAVIQNLTEAAYIWGLPAEYTYRFAKYNQLVTSPTNTLAYSSVPAEWNNRANANAGNSSVLYISSTMNLTTQDLVYTVPPTASDYIPDPQGPNFTVSQMFDSFINVFADPGTRTTATSEPTSYLVVGPNSRYAKDINATILGHTYPVISSDTNTCELLVRILTNTLSSGAKGVSATLHGVAEKFAMNTLQQFQANNNTPVFPANFQITPPTQAQIDAADQYQNTPVLASAFFGQVGDSLAENPLPTSSTGLSGTALANMPSYMPPQAHAVTTYQVPSAGQQDTLALFKPLGLTQAGFTMPKGWTLAQRAAFNAGFAAGASFIQGVLGRPTTSKTNYWSYLNRNIGTYANGPVGYMYRAVGVIAGGFPNLPLDGFYAPIFTNNNNGLDGAGTPLDGNNTYSVTFTPPGPHSASPLHLPVVGTLPPMVLDSKGKDVGFWSITLYQPDEVQAASPYLSQVSTQNLAYSSADEGSVTKVVPGAGKTSPGLMTLPTNPGLGTLNEGTALLFGSHAASFGLSQNTPYFIHFPVKGETSCAAGAACTFELSSTWVPMLSTDSFPIGGLDMGTPGNLLPLASGSGTLRYGIVQPVTQLGSSQIDPPVGQPGLKANTDGSYTIWMAPTLPAGVSATNWIPTPSTAYFSGLVPAGTKVGTTIEPMMRMYDTQPGEDTPSIMPCPLKVLACVANNIVGQASYVLPAVDGPETDQRRHQSRYLH